MRMQLADWLISRINYAQMWSHKAINHIWLVGKEIQYKTSEDCVTNLSNFVDGKLELRWHYLSCISYGTRNFRRVKESTPR